MHQQYHHHSSKSSDTTLVGTPPHNDHAIHQLDYFPYSFQAKALFMSPIAIDIIACITHKSQPTGAGVT